MREILLKSNDSCFSNDVESQLNVDISTKVRLLPNENLSEHFSLNDQYNKERDECNRFRLILGINPICSNVLYNAKTEIVINEGSDDTKVICDCKDGSLSKDECGASNAANSTGNISYLLALRNTEYSHPELGNFTYHCGYNIFNNHMLRNDGFVHVNKAKSKTGVYNTIADYSRTNDGDIVEQDISIKYTTKTKTEMHLYHFDSILSMRNAFLERCEERDGWWGFINPSFINIPNRDGKDNKDILINSLINNKKSCEFIDLYPDRSLYSFIPKYNKYRNRLEKNWDYCITYPYKNESIYRIYGDKDKICKNDSVRVNFIKKYNSNGIEILECHSWFKHNLKSGDYINLYYIDSASNQEQSKQVKVENIGDNIGENKDRIFTIKFADISSLYNEIKEKTGNYDGYFFYKRISGGSECQYYFRKFKKIGELKSDINKIAFGKNIYGDDTAQIIFTDDVDVSDLIDNNGKPVSKVYFTVIKRNAGHEIWYEEGSKETPKTASTIEYSHCFGEVTSGLDFSGMKEEPWDYNIHRLHNLENNFMSSSDEYRTFEMWGDALSKRPFALENNLTIDKDEFYGDIVEYDIANAKEIIISPVYHRVNTAQRETFDICFRDILQDKIYSDDYDTINGRGEGFNIKTYYLNDVENSILEWEESPSVKDVANRESGNKQLIYGNIMPEGNYYNPHTQIDLKSEDVVISESPAKLINYHADTVEYDSKNYVLSIKAPTNYGFSKGEFVALYKDDTKWYEIIKVENDVLYIQLESIFSEDDFKKYKYKIYWTPNDVPTYAKLLINRRKFVWRKLLNQSELKSTNPLYNTTFSNGRLYIEKNINFFLRRQDPFGKYGLSSPRFEKTEKKFSNPMDDYNIPGSKQADFSGIIYSINNFDNCY